MLFITLFPRALSLIFKDKMLLMLSFVPLIIGTVLYSFIGSWFYKFVMGRGEAYIQAQLGDGTGASIVYYILVAVMTVLLFFIVNFTFVLIVSVLASPFNDLMSKRIEKKFYGITPTDSGEGFLISAVKIIFNEIKKITLIVLLTLLSLVLSFIPILAPITIFVSAILLAVQFLDYSWSRHDLPANECLRDVLNNLFGYGVGGVAFVALMSIPGINLLALPLGVVYFTCFWLEKNKDSIKSGSLEEVEQ